MPYPGAATLSGDGLKFMKESKDITGRERAVSMTMLRRSWLWTSAITSVLAVVVMGLTGRAAAAENRAAEPVSKRTAVSGEQSGGSASSQPDKRIKRRSEEHMSELQSRSDLVCRLLLEKKKKRKQS